MIVVGAVNTDGTLSYFSQGGPPIVSISAPGSVRLGPRFGGIACAAGQGTGTVYKLGTSYAAPQVVGLAAYFLSTVPSLLVPGQVARSVKVYIWQKAWQRNSGPKAVFNDFDFRTGQVCAVRRRRAKMRRQDDGSD